MTGLAAFLTARLGEDEAVARLAASEGGTWKQDDPVRFPGSISTTDGGRVAFDEGAPDENQGGHIARHDPARVIREVEAKRAILAEHRPSPSPRTPGRCRVCASGAWVRLALPCPTLRALAAVWRDHPDYDPAWG